MFLLHFPSFLPGLGVAAFSFFFFFYLLWLEGGWGGVGVVGGVEQLSACVDSYG